MDREILFRAKRMDNGEWAEGLPSYAPDGDITELEVDVRHRSSVMNSAFVNIDPETVCQYTGLTDKNGRKIFEGDIIRDSSGGIYTVNWSDENGMYETRQYDCSIENFEIFFACESEVIGNIFDNPELLEVDGEREEY